MIYKKIANKVAAKKCVKLTQDQWLHLDERWKSIYAKTRKWLWKLDTSLPGRLGKFGDWLFNAEELLAEELEMLESHEEMAVQIGNFLQRHRVCILKLNQIVSLVKPVFIEQRVLRSTAI